MVGADAGVSGATTSWRGRGRDVGEEEQAGGAGLPATQEKRGAEPLIANRTAHDAQGWCGAVRVRPDRVKGGSVGLTGPKSRAERTRIFRPRSLTLKILKFLGEVIDSTNNLKRKTPEFLMK